MKENSIRHAADVIRDGGIVIYPTETFFGIGCRYDDEKAIAGVFRSKRRLLAMPLPLIVADRQQMDAVALSDDAWRSDVDRLADLFWPGALTLILPARRHLSPLLTGGSSTVALRVSPHPVARELALQTGVPIVSSSANISGQAAVTEAARLNPELCATVDMILDLPPAPLGGKPSTIVRPLGGKKLMLHREGALNPALLADAGFTILSQKQ